jgi:hypothetical protein
MVAYFQEHHQEVAAKAVMVNPVLDGYGMARRRGVVESTST